MSHQKYSYFISDAHLGVPSREASLEREKKLVKWLNQVAPQAQAIYLLGDIFDFWFEYRHVVPKGFVRLFGAIASITDQGTPVHFFTGNHDLWIKDYFQKELGMIVHHKGVSTQINGRKFFIHHGDGLGKGDYGYKFLKKVFCCKPCQWLFARLHPNFAIDLARLSSRRSRMAHAEDDEKFLGEDKEFLAQWAKQKLEETHYDFFVFGHRHLPLEIKIGENSTYYNLGEWFKRFTYGVYDGDTFKLQYFEKEGNPAVNKI